MLKDRFEHTELPFKHEGYQPHEIDFALSRILTSETLKHPLLLESFPHSTLNLGVLYEGESAENVSRRMQVRLLASGNWGLQVILRCSDSGVTPSDLDYNNSILPLSVSELQILKPSGGSLTMVQSSYPKEPRIPVIPTTTCALAHIIDIVRASKELITNSSFSAEFNRLVVMPLPDVDYYEEQFRLLDA